MIGSTSATVSGKMTEEEGNYSFEVVTKEAGNTVTMTTKVLFRSVSVVMPTYNTDASTQQKPTTTVPPATTVPEEAPQPELTNAPENETNSPE